MVADDAKSKCWNDEYGVERQADMRQQVTKATFAFIIGSGFAARKNGWNELHDSTMKRKVRVSLDESFRVHRSSLRFMVWGFSC